MLLTSSGLAAITATSMCGFGLSCSTAGGRNRTSAHKMIRKGVISMRLLRKGVSDTVSQPQEPAENDHQSLASKVSVRVRFRRRLCLPISDRSQQSHSPRYSPWCECSYSGYDLKLSFACALR